MGRLFWKFFIFIWLAQVGAILATGTSFWFKTHSQNGRPAGLDSSPPASMLIDSAALTLNHGGVSALRELVSNMRRHRVFAVDETGKEILDRPVDSSVIDKARFLADNETPGGESAFRRIMASDGHTYLLFVPTRPNEQNMGPPFRSDRGPIRDESPPRREEFLWSKDGLLIPIFPTIATLFASLIAAFLLARHFSKPIRSMRTAFEAATSGNLQMRLMPLMGNRNDEMADLGRDFDRMTDKLRLLMDSQQKLLHDVSHEMRSPLARLQVALGLARQQPEKIDSWIERMERESVRIDQLVGELLTISRLEAGVMGSMNDRINVGDLIGHIIDDARFESASQGKDISLSWGKEASLKGQTELLHRAFENVIRNAVRHTPEGSSVEVRGSVHAGLLHVTVCDHGPGVPNVELLSIFEPFFRGSNSRGETTGHGLGLTIAKRVIQAHGGNISATNQPEGGLCVHIDIPVEESELKTPPPKRTTVNH